MLRWFAITSLVLLAVPARADDRAQCLGASSSAQDLHRENKLIEARAQLLVCVRDLCPAVVRRDCVQWLDEVDAAMPTIVIGAKDHLLHDVVSAHVLVDGAAYLDHLDGMAKPIDPGVHKLRLEVDGAPPVQQDIVIRVGEKNRIVELTVPPRMEPTPLPTVAPATPPAVAPALVAPADTPAARRSRILPLALGAGAIVLAGGALGFELWSQRTYDKSKREPDDAKQRDLWSSANTERHVAQVLVGAGVACAGVAAWSWIRAGHESTTPIARRHDPAIQPIVGPGIAGLEVGGRW
jgi:hypothetical protein